MDGNAFDPLTLGPGDIVEYPSAERNIHKGELTVMGVDHSRPQSLSSIHVKNKDGFDFYIGHGSVRTIRRAGETAPIEDPKSDKRGPTTTNFYVESTVREFFETKEELEHYIKEHFDVPFDDKLGLLKGGEVRHYDEAEDSEVIMSLKEVTKEIEQ